MNEWREHEAILKVAQLRKEVTELRAKLKAAEEEVARLKSMKSSFRVTGDDQSD